MHVVIVRFDIDDAEAKKIFGEIRPVKPYLRYTACPKLETTIII